MHRLIVVVSAAVAATANARAKLIDTVGGEYTFTAGLSADGRAPASHYWCSWKMSNTDHDGLLTEIESIVDDKEAETFDGDTLSPSDVLATLGLMPLEEAP